MPAKYPKCSYCGRSFENMRAVQVHCSHHNKPKGPKEPGAPVLGRDYTMDYSKPEAKQDYYERKKAGEVFAGRGKAKSKKKYTFKPETLAKRAEAKANNAKRPSTRAGRKAHKAANTKTTKKEALSKLIQDAMAENRTQVLIELEVAGLPQICVPITLGTPFFTART